MHASSENIGNHSSIFALKILFSVRGRYLTLVSLVTMALGGCAVGPDFKSPSVPSSLGDSYTSTALPTRTDAAPGTAGTAQTFAYGKNLPDQWWTLFHSVALDQLIQSALKQNPTLASAQASLRQAQENYNAEAGTLNYPSVNGKLGATRERAQFSGTTPTVATLYNASVNVSYTLDVFGASSRQLESLMAAVDYQTFEVEAAYQALISNVITTAIVEASLRAQYEATQEVLNVQQKQLTIIERQLELGVVNRATALAQRTQVAQTQALLSPLEKSLWQTRHQLAVYVGKLPSESGLPEFQLSSLHLPENLPVSLPSELTRQRPDVRASEALLHEASAQLGVAIANQYPQINLTGSYGDQRVVSGGLGVTSVLWNLGAGLTQPLFNGGALSAKRRAAVAAYEQAEAKYRQTVLTAFQNVADSLRAIESDATTLSAQSNAEALARESLDLSTQQYQLGVVNYLTLLNAQRSYQQAHINLVQAQAARFTDTVALFLSLGGSWSNQPATLANTQPENK